MIIHCVKSKFNDDINVHLIIMAPTSGQYWLLIIITYGRWSVRMFYKKKYCEILLDDSYVTNNYNYLAIPFKVMWQTIN